MLVDINRIAALRGIEDRGRDDAHRRARRGMPRCWNPLSIAARVPLLAQAMPHVAHMAVRNRGTTCGSLALADPSAEMPAVAVALECRRSVLRKPSGARARCRRAISSRVSTKPAAATTR